MSAPVFGARARFAAAVSVPDEKIEVRIVDAPTLA